MLTYSRSKGAFAGLTLEGAVVRQDSDSTIAIYGKDVPFRSILLGRVPSPASTRAFLQSVSDASRQASAQEVRQGEQK